ncbi:hypothetical protein LRP88_14427 [Fusarium phalaenopsidis]
MYAPSDTNNALKRRRLDEETPPRVQETGHPAFATGSQAGYGSYTGPFAAQQFYLTSVPQSVSVTPQLDPIDIYSPISPHHNNTWNPYHTFQSQNATGNTAQGSSSLQPWQSAVCVEAQYLDVTAPTPALQLSEEQESEKVCFGMIETSPKADAPKFISNEHPEVSGQVLSEHGQMIQGLLEDETLDLYISCTIPDSQSSAQHKMRSTPLQCTLDITVYGPPDLFDEIGEWFEEYQVYLQDPRECHIDAKYYNPHRLSSDDFASCDLVSEVVSRGSKILHLESIPQQKDLLDDLDSQDDLEEARQPTVIKRSLRNFLNRISNAYQAEEPPQCYGGIIADPMGLGKTLTMITLAAADLDRDNTDMDTSEDGQSRVAATLIVVPPPRKLDSSPIVDPGIKI